MSRVLSRQETTALRGIAIVIIMLHNYCHTLSFAIKESEFYFYWSETQRWADYLRHIDSYLLINMFSWGGYMALGVFMFLTGYCLVCRYEDGDNPVKVETLPFIWKHYKKLLALVLVPFAAFTLVHVAVLHDKHISLLSVIGQLGMFNTLVPGMAIVPRPYWYLSLAMQLYVIYALFRLVPGKASRWFLPLLLIVVGYTLHLVVERGGEFAFWLLSNSTTAFIPFGMGLLVARYANHTPSRATWAVTLVIATCAAVACGFNYEAWGLKYGLATIALIALVKVVRGKALVIAEAVGCVSALIYVLHPLTRFAVDIVAYQWEWFEKQPHLRLSIFIVSTALAVIIYRKLRIDEWVKSIFK